MDDKLNEQEKISVRFCPKCNNAMKEVKPPDPSQHIAHIVPLAPGIGGATVDVRGGLVVEVFVCSRCRYVEMFSFGRGGAEE